MILGHGMFWKKGSSVRSWKHRRYEIHDNMKLYYFDISTTPPTQKGSIDVSEIFISDGNPENLKHCTSFPLSQSFVNSTSSGCRISLNIEANHDHRVLETVLDSQQDVVTLLVALFLVSRRNNVAVSELLFVC